MNLSTNAYFLSPFKVNLTIMTKLPLLSKRDYLFKILLLGDRIKVEKCFPLCYYNFTRNLQLLYRILQVLENILLKRIYEI